MERPGNKLAFPTHPASVPAMPGTFHNLKYHIVFSTKGRTPWLDDAIRPQVHAYLGGIIRGERGVALAIGGVADHVHILLSWRTDEALSTLMRNLKAHSSKWIHQQFPQLAAFEWQEGYSVFTVSESQVVKVRNYIASQEEHHRQKSFRDELVALLKGNGVSYDERYLLG